MDRVDEMDTMAAAATQSIFPLIPLLTGARGEPE